MALGSSFGAFVLIHGVAGWLSLNTPATNTAADTPGDFTIDLAARLHASPEDQKQRESASADHIARIEALAAAEPSLDVAHSLLAEANWWLAEAIAPPAARLLLAFSTEDDRVAIHDAASHAIKAVGQYRVVIKLLDDADPDRRRELKSHAETLEAFANLFAALSGDKNNGGDETHCRRAALDLSLAREHEDARIAAAAQLWQAFAWEAAGRRDRALDTLPTALGELKELPFDVYAELLRARLLASDGMSAAAATLLTRMRTLGAKRLSQAAAIASARQLIVVLECDILLKWKQRVAPEQPKLAEEIDRRLRDLQNAHFADAEEGIYQLNTAIPVLCRAPDRIVPITVSTEEPLSDPPASAPATATSSAPTE